MLALLALSCSLGACSLGVVPRARCEADACQAAFGFGSVCGEDGFCRQVAPAPRCTRTFPEDLFTRPGDHADTIVIGSLMDRSLATQEARENAVELAIRGANDTGGLDGRSFGVVFCDIREDNAIDGLTRQEAAVESARYLAEELQLPAILGPSATDDVNEVFLAIGGSGALVMTPAATGDALTELDQTAPTDSAPGRLWRTAVPDRFQASAIAADMNGRAVASVAVIHSSDDYGEGLAAGFQSEFTGDVMLLPFGASGPVTQTVMAAELAVDEVLFIASTTDHMVQFVQATHGDAGYDDKSLFLTDSAANSDFRTRTMPYSSRWPQIRGTRPRLPSATVYNVFAAAYDVAFGEDPAAFSYSAQAYDAAWLVLYGIAWAHHQENAISGVTIARGLRRVSSGARQDIVPDDFQALAEAFSRGESVDVEGASGALDYDAATEEIAEDPAMPPIEIWTVDDLMP